MPSKKTELRFDRGTASDGQAPLAALWGTRTELLRGYTAVCGDYRNQLLDSFLLVKKIAAHTNAEIGSLDPALGRIIGQCCDEILNGQWREQFLLNTVLLDADYLLQENVNEVIANRCTVILGGQIGKYEQINPDLHLRLNQPSREAFQIALRATILANVRHLQNSLLDLERLLRRKSLEFDRVDSVRDLKVAEPSKLTGQKFNIFGAKIERSVKRINDVCQSLMELNFLSSRTGTESGEQLKFNALFIEKMKAASNINFRPADLSGSSNYSVSDFVELSSALKELALELRNICKELRVEIEIQRLTERQTGASDHYTIDHHLIPLEHLIMVALDIVGRDMTVSLCAAETSSGKQAAMPLLTESLLKSLDGLCKSLPVFNIKTVSAFQPGNTNRSDLLPTHIAQTAHHI